MKNKKSSAAKNIVLAVAVIGLGYLVRHQIAATHDPLWSAAGWLLTAYVVVRIGLALKRGYAAYRLHTASGLNVHNLDQLTTAAMEPWMRGYYTVEKKIYRGCWRVLTGAVLAPAGEFPVSNGPNAWRLAAGGLVALALASVAGALAVPQLLASFWPQLFAVGSIAASALYLAIWIIGDWRNLREGGHSVRDDSVILELGIRCCATIPMASIASCAALNESFAGYRARHCIGGAESWTVSPAERPNVVLELASATVLETLVFGYPRALGKRCVALYVDQPAAFARAVTAARRQAENAQAAA